MTFDRNALEDMPRDELIEHARNLGVTRAEVMTRVELTDEILRRATVDPDRRRQARGWLGVARDLLASVIEQGLNLPDAAALIRGEVPAKPRRAPPPPVATVTLAEIYAAQGHYDRGLQMLDEVLSTEPDHQVARDLRQRLAQQSLEVTHRRVFSKAEVVDDFDDDSDGWFPDEDEEKIDEAAADSGGQESRSEPAADTTAVSESGPRRRLDSDAGDEGVVILSGPPGEVRVYWERFAERADPGRYVIELVEMQQSPKGARRVDRRLEARSSTGGVRISGIAEGAVVRASMGFERDGRFHPTAVAAEVAIQGEGVQVLFAPRRLPPFEQLGSRAAAFFESLS